MTHETSGECERFQAQMPDLLLSSVTRPDDLVASDRQVSMTQLPAETAQHLANCERCRRDWTEMQATLGLLDQWVAPEPSAFFNTRLAARLREEKLSGKPGWVERVWARLLLDGNHRLRPLMAGALALLFAVIGAGSYAGFEILHETAPTQRVSATVQDLEWLDANAQTLDELAAFDEPSTPSSSNANDPF